MRNGQERCKKRRENTQWSHNLQRPHQHMVIGCCRMINDCSQATAGPPSWRKLHYAMLKTVYGPRDPSKCRLRSVFGCRVSNALACERHAGPTPNAAFFPCHRQSSRYAHQQAKEPGERRISDSPLLHISRRTSPRGLRNLSPLQRETCFSHLIFEYADHSYAREETPLAILISLVPLVLRREDYHCRFGGREVAMK